MVENKIIILFATDFFFPEYLGGSARLASDLAQGLFERGHSLTVVTRRSGGVYSGGNAKRKYNTIYHNNLTQLISVLFSRYDFVVCQHFSMAFFVSIFFKKEKLIYIYHGPVAEEYRLKKGKKGIGFYIRYFIENFVLWRTKKILVISEYARNKLSAIRHKKVVNLGPLHSFEINSLRNKISKKKLKLLTVRRLTPRTGVRELCELVELSNHLELTVIGKGELMNCLIQRLLILNFWEAFQIRSLLLPTKVMICLCFHQFRLKRLA